MEYWRNRAAGKGAPLPSDQTPQGSESVEYGQAVCLGGRDRREDAGEAPARGPAL